MASGKTAVGKKAAAALGWRFLDADAEIEREAGRTVNQIFADEGEAGFRRAEERTVLRLLDESAGEGGEGTVLSLGGGAVTIPALLQRLEKEPLVVYLDVDPETAFRRAQGGKRPLAKDPESFRELYVERLSLYRGAAGVIVETRGKNVQQLAGEIAAVVRERI